MTLGTNSAANSIPIMQMMQTRFETAVRKYLPAFGMLFPIPTLYYRWASYPSTPSHHVSLERSMTIRNHGALALEQRTLGWILGHIVTLSGRFDPVLHNVDIPGVSAWFSSVRRGGNANGGHQIYRSYGHKLLTFFRCCPSSCAPVMERETE